MTASTRGLLVAAGTAAVVLGGGLVFIFGIGRSEPPEKPVAAKPADESALSLEARRQARLSQSQAMLGGGKAAPAEPAPELIMPPTPPPPAPPPPPPSALPLAAAPSAPASAPPTAAKAGVVVPLPPPEQRCTVATSGTSPVAEACRQGGISEAKRTMKRLVGRAKEHGARFTCESCHLDVEKFPLREDARTEFATLLEGAK